MSGAKKVCSFCYREVGLPHHPGCIARGQVQEREAMDAEHIQRTRG